MRRSSPFRALAAACLAVATLVPSWACAADLGVRGATWPVAEPDLLMQIEARLVAMERSGELARLEAQARARARARLEAPEPVAGIAPARERRSRTFDPAVTLAHDVRAADGTVIAAAGTRIDPFALSSLTRDLLFVDGTREAEVEWALGVDRPSKIVLLAGLPLALARIHGRPFFFDQGGRFAARFGLRFTPSLVTRDGGVLRIEEIPIDSLPRSGSGDREDGS